MAGETRTQTGDADAPGAGTEAGASSGSGDDDLLEGRPEPNYYAVLGVARDASDDEIQRAFRRLAKLWHPDRYAGAPPVMRERAERRMRLLLRARDVLTDPVRRHEYDVARVETPVEGRNARPVDFVYTPPPYFGTGSASHLARVGGNPNGAGQFAGVLALILGLALIGGTLNGRAGSSTGAFLVLALAVGLFCVAGICFTSGSPLARAANAWMEADPAPDPEGTVDATDTADASQWMRRGARDGFERLVEEALDTVPEEFQSWLNNVLVEVLDEPTEDMLRQMQVREGCTLLGLYTGVPLTHQYGRDVPPEIITIFQGPIERYCDGDPDAIRDQVRRTVLHELAHHFGMDHDAMPDWIQ